MIYSLRNRVYIFLASYLLIVSSSILIISSTHFQFNEIFLSTAIMIDILLVAPFLFYFLFKNSSLPDKYFSIVIIIGISIISYILPANIFHILDYMKIILPIIEIFIIGFLFFKIAKYIKIHQNSSLFKSDFPDILRKILKQKLKNRFVTNILTTEISIFYYFLFGWKSNISTINSYTYHKKSGYNSFILIILFVITLETFAVHQFLIEINTTLAWIFFALSIYSFVFLIGDYNAIKCRPVYFDKNFLYIKNGIRWESIIPLKEIINIESSRNYLKSKSILNLVLSGDSNIKITLKEPNKAVGLYGITKTFSSVILFIDEKDEFLNKIREMKL